MTTSPMSPFKLIIIVMLFYSFGITMFTYALAGRDTQGLMAPFEQGVVSMDSVSAKVQASMGSMLGVPLLAQFGALMLFSGNILIDLLLNFVFAIPQMMMILISGIMVIFSIDAFISAQIQILIYVSMMALQFVSLMQMLTNLRSRGNFI